MQIRADDTVLVELPGEPETSQEIDAVIRYVYGRDDFDVVLDFGNVTILTSRSLAPLLHLRNVLSAGGRRLLLCNVDQATKGVFSVTVLDGVFQIVDDRDGALATVKTPSNSPGTIGTI